MTGDKVQQVATHLASINRAASIENLYVLSRTTALQVKTILKHPVWLSTLSAGKSLQEQLRQAGGDLVELNPIAGLGSLPVESNGLLGLRFTKMTMKTLVV